MTKQLFILKGAWHTMKKASYKPARNLMRLAVILVAVTVAVAAAMSTSIPGAGASAATAIDRQGYIMVVDAAGLDAMRDNPSGKYRLYADIDLSGYVSKNSTAEKGWFPIGYGKHFTGELDGNGHVISGLWSSSKWCVSYKGLFSVLSGAEVVDLTIKLDERGITGGYEVGGLAGVTKRGTVIDNVTVEGGKVVVTGGGYAGGLVGFVQGNPADTITNSGVYGTYTETSGNYSGGFVGVVEGGSLITNCEAVGTVSRGYSYVAGFVGALKSASKIACCFASGSVGARGSYGGGFAGVAYERSAISNCRADGDVLVNGSYAGGFAGAIYGESQVTDAFAYGNVGSNYYAGGLIGTLYDTSIVARSCAYGNVATKNYIAGGLVGEAIYSAIMNCYARGNVIGTTGVGGLVGYFSGSGVCVGKIVMNSYSSGTAIGKGTAEYGAFNGRSGVFYVGTNYYDATRAATPSGYGTSGSPMGLAESFPQGRSIVEMMQRRTFVGWDFDNVWKIDEYMSYPYFEWDCPGRLEYGVEATSRYSTYDVGNEPQEAYTTLLIDVRVTPNDLPITFVSVAFKDKSGAPIDGAEAGLGPHMLLPDFSPDGEYELYIDIFNSALPDALRKYGDIEVEVTVGATRPNGKLVLGTTSATLTLRDYS